MGVAVDLDGRARVVKVGSCQVGEWRSDGAENTAALLILRAKFQPRLEQMNESGDFLSYNKTKYNSTIITLVLVVD